MSSHVVGLRIAQSERREARQTAPLPSLRDSGSSFTLTQRWSAGLNSFAPTALASRITESLDADVSLELSESSARRAKLISPLRKRWVPNTQ